MPWGLKRFQEAHCLHFITFSCHHREALLGTPKARDVFERMLEQVRGWYGFYVRGYVVMPEHVHLLISEPERTRLSTALQMLKQNVARELRLPEGNPFWQQRYYDFNVWSEAKRVEKLRYIHRNPVRRGLVKRPEDWKWSSFLHYATGVEGVVEIESEWTARKRARAGVVPTVRRRENESQNPRPVSHKPRDKDGAPSKIVFFSPGMELFLIDGTYELFRHYYAVPSARDKQGREVGAVRAVLASVLGMINGGATHIAVATDHVIESFRNELWAGYKTSDGVEPDLLAQFPLLEDVLSAAGIVVWPMVEFEADDALAAAAAAGAQDARVERVVICTPDKDLAQCVRGTQVVQLNRRTRVTLDEPGIIQKYGVPPLSIPDYLALVGDSADGYPGLAGWGAKSSAAVLAKFGHLESIPKHCRDWHVNATNAGALAETLSREWDDVLLFRTLATLRTDIALFDDVEELRWNGPKPEFDAIAAELDSAVTEIRKASSKKGASRKIASA